MVRDRLYGRGSNHNVSLELMRSSSNAPEFASL
jgi:hypothetical protein